MHAAACRLCTKIILPHPATSSTTPSATTGFLVLYMRPRPTVNVSSYYYMCPHTSCNIINDAIHHYRLPCTTMYVSSNYTIVLVLLCVLILIYTSTTPSATTGFRGYYYYVIVLYVCPHTRLLYMCPDTSVCMSSYAPGMCVLILLHVCPHTRVCVCFDTTICVLELLHMCPGTAAYVSILIYVCLCKAL
jgi:hypothetical protein